MKDFVEMVRVLKSSKNKDPNQLIKELVGGASEVISKGSGAVNFTGHSFNPDTYKPARENMKKGGMVSSASKRADGCAIRGKTKGRFV